MSQSHLRGDLAGVQSESPSRLRGDLAKPESARPLPNGGFYVPGDLKEKSDDSLPKDFRNTPETNEKPNRPLPDAPSEKKDLYDLVMDVCGR